MSFDFSFSRRLVKPARVGLLLAIAALSLAVAAKGALAETPAPKDPLNLKTTAFLVEITTKDGKQVEVLKPLPKGIFPGALIQYNISGVNESKADLKDIRTEGMIPAETHYVDKSAKCQGGGETLFSYDKGATWAKAPLTKTVTGPDGKKKTVTVPPEEYTGIRFVVKKLKAGASFTGIYRVQLK